MHLLENETIELIISWQSVSDTLIASHKVLYKTNNRLYAAPSKEQRTVRIQIKPTTFEHTLNLSFCRRWSFPSFIIQINDFTCIIYDTKSKPRTFISQGFTSLHRCTAAAVATALAWPHHLTHSIWKFSKQKCNAGINLYPCDMLHVRIMTSSVPNNDTVSL